MIKNKNNEVHLSAPWDKQNTTQRMTNNMCSQSGSIEDDETTKLFITERTKLHNSYIIEQEKTKRIALILAVILILGAALILICAPAEKENLSYAISGALFIFAAGAAGYRRVWGKMPFTEFKADNGNQN